MLIFRKQARSYGEKKTVLKLEIQIFEGLNKKCGSLINYIALLLFSQKLRSEMTPDIIIEDDSELSKKSCFSGNKTNIQINLKNFS